MFYSGGARKKHAVREILTFKPDDPEPVTESISDTDTDSDTGSDKHDKRSQKSSSKYDSDSETNKHDDIDTDTDTDTEDDTDDQLSNPDKNDYIVTLGSNTTTNQHYRYTFIDEELEYDIEEFADTHPEIKKYQLVIYKINTRSSLPFLEFLFYYDKSSEEHCHLPYYSHKTKHNVRKETDQIMNKLFTGKYRFKGYFHDEQSDQCFVFYEKYFVNEPKNEKMAYVSLKNSDNWLWVCTTEIVYHKKYMTIPINESSVDFFIAYPTVGILQATLVSMDSDRHFQSVNIEAPTILYYGSDICYARNTVTYGLKREPIIARYGPFYYFTTLDHSFYWACYLKSKQKTKKRESSNGGISRYAVFTKKMKTAFVDDDYDTLRIKKYRERKGIFDTMVNKFHPTQEDYHPDKTYDSIYSYDYDWTIDYDSIYNGYYAKSDKNILRPIWCICDHHNFQLLSFHEVDIDKCPDHYDPKYTEYTLL
jgi:hypothetical protein